MASTSCVTNPTETRFGTITSESTSTSFTESLTTLPPSTSTSVTTECLDPPPTESVTETTCTSSTVISSVITIPGAVSTAQVPVIITIPITETRPTETLFTTSCTTIAPDPEPTSDTDTTIITTPPPTTFTSETSTTLPNGEVVPTTQIITSTAPPSTVVVTTQPPNGTQRDDNGNGSNTNLGAILGGAIGGLVGLIAIVLIIWWFFNRRRTDWDAYFDREDELTPARAVMPSRDKSRRLDMSDDTDTLNAEPKPYHYGLVGSAGSLSPPSHNIGLMPQGAAPPGMLAVRGRTPSETPLISGYNGGGGAPTLGPPSTASGGASRPSTGGSLGQSYAYGAPGPQGNGQQYNMNNMGNSLNPNASLPYDERRRSRPSVGSNLSMGGPSMYHESVASGNGGHGSMSIGIAAMGLASSSNEPHSQPVAGPSSRPLSSGSDFRSGSPTDSPPTLPRQLFVTNNPPTPPPQSPDFESTRLGVNLSNVPGPSRTPAPENIFTSGSGGVALGAGAAAARPAVVASQNAALEKMRLRAVNADTEASGSGSESRPVVVHRDAGSALPTSLISSSNVSGSVSGLTGSSGQAQPQAQPQPAAPAASSSRPQASSSGQSSTAQAQPQPERQGTTESGNEPPPPAYTD